jgi:hypothetical protein
MLTFFRAMIILLAIIFLSVLAAYLHLQEPDLKQSEIIKILNGSMIIVGLAYTIMTYEFNHSKTLNEIRVRRTTATYEIIKEWNSAVMTNYQKICYEFENKHEIIFLHNDIDNFIEINNDGVNTEYIKSLTGILNYFESIAVGIGEDLMDETLMRKYFKGLHKRKQKCTVE